MVHETPAEVREKGGGWRGGAGAAENALRAGRRQAALVYFLGDLTVAGDGERYRGLVGSMAAMLDQRASTDPEAPSAAMHPHCFSCSACM